MFRIRLRKTDRLFTRVVRRTYNFTCQKCGKVYLEDGDLHNLGVSHYYGRSRESTRYDLDNTTLLCNLPCHQRWGGEERAEYTEYMINRLGQDRFDLLTLRAHLYSKRDDVIVELILKDMLKELEEVRND